MLARIQNAFVNALNATKSGKFPKHVVIVFDDDLISYLDYKHSNEIASLLGIWLEWIVGELKSAIAARKDVIPLKCQKVMPFFYWVTAPVHYNFLKERNNMWVKLNLSMDSITKQQENMCVIKLKEHWDSKDGNIVINNRITEIGMAA